MKKFWVKIVPWNKKLFAAALENNADAVVLEKDYSEKAKSFGLIETIAQDGDKKLGTDVVEIEIKSKLDEEKAAVIAKKKIVVVKTADWRVIPLENLVAQTSNVFAEVSNASEAKTALEILEKGVAGIVLNSDSVNEIKETGKIIKQDGEKFVLEKAKIVSIKPVGSGDRVCIDSCTNMKVGEGMLIGNASNGFFLVHAECIENEFVEQRPFRVNAGAVHAYIKMPNDKTSYLSELKAGSEILIVNANGETQTAIVGRVKIEKRPMLLVEAIAKEQKVSLVLQNAETIRLVNPEGKPISVVKLKTGDEILALTEESGRHFGMKIIEKINEK
jgi:3-dehydroquinate synthase II